MLKISSLLLITLLLSCERSDTGTPAARAVGMACITCGKTPSEMQWLKALILQSEVDMSLRGNIYRGYYDTQVIIIHQPMIMSCLACVIYDCDGNRLDTSVMDHEKIRLNMDSHNLIYR